MVKKNKLPEKPIAFVIFRKKTDMDCHTKGSEQPTCTRISTGETDCPCVDGGCPKIDTLKAKRQQEFSNSVIDMTSEDQKYK